MPAWLAVIEHVPIVVKVSEPPVVTVQIVVVVEPSQIALPMAREILRATEQIGIPRQRSNVVVINRAAGQPPVSWQEAEQALNHEMLGVVNGVPDLAAQASAAGVPMVTYQPNTAFATQIAKLSEEIVKHGRTAGPVQVA